MNNNSTSPHFLDIVDPYEKPVGIMELDEIVVYQEGKRVELESEEKAELLREASLHHEAGKVKHLIKRKITK